MNRWIYDGAAAKCSLSFIYSSIKQKHTTHTVTNTKNRGSKYIFFSLRFFPYRFLFSAYVQYAPFIIIIIIFFCVGCLFTIVVVVAGLTVTRAHIQYTRYEETKNKNKTKTKINSLSMLTMPTAGLCWCWLQRKKSVLFCGFSIGRCWHCWRLVMG